MSTEPDLTLEQIADHIKNIGEMTREEMATLHRFSPSGHVYFDSRYPSISDAFTRRFASLGGFSPWLSKLIDSKHKREDEN